MKQKLLVLLVVLGLLSLAAITGIARAHTIWSTQTWTWDLVHYCFWGANGGDDGPQNSVSGFIQAPNGDRGGWHEVDIVTYDNGTTCDRIDIEPLLAVGYNNLDDFMIAVSVSTPYNDGTDYWAEWAELDWADRHHKFWFEVWIEDNDTIGYTLYDCDEDETIFDDTWDIPDGDYTMCHFHGYAMSFEGYDTYIDATYRGQFSEGDGTPWGYYRDNDKFSSEYFLFINNAGTPVSSGASPFEAVSLVVTTDPCTGPSKTAQKQYDFPDQSDAPKPPDDREPHLIQGPYSHLNPADRVLMYIAGKTRLLRLFGQTSVQSPRDGSYQMQAYMWTDAYGPAPTCTPYPERATPAPSLNINIDQAWKKGARVGWDAWDCDGDAAVRLDWRGPGTPCPPVDTVRTVSNRGGFDYLEYHSGTPVSGMGKRACAAITCKVNGVPASDVCVKYLFPPPVCTGWWDEGCRIFGNCEGRY